MPPLPDAPGVIRVDFKHSEAGDPSLGNRTFWKYTGGAPSESNLNDLASATAGQWNTTLSGLANTGVTLDEVIITDLTSDTAARGSWAGSHAGTRSGTALPLDNCTLLNFQISRRYRGGKPRMYARWGVNGDLTNVQEWGATWIAEIHTVWGEWTTAFQAFEVGTMVIGSQANVSYYQGFASVQNPVTKRWANIPTPRTGSAIIDTVVSYSANPIVGSQRRRLRA